jgi:RHS repeat-associated protein
VARIGFIGQEQDIEHGYFNMGARYYDPEIGRFLSVDPLFEMYTEFSPYNYCNNSPMMFRDPSGMSSEMELVGEFEGYYHYILNQIDVTAEKSPDDNYWYNIPRLGGGGGSSAIGVNKMGYSSLISGIMNNNAPLHSFFYFNFAESGEMNGNARGIGNTGSANGKSNSSNGGGSDGTNSPPPEHLNPYYRGKAGEVNTSNLMNDLNVFGNQVNNKSNVNEGFKYFNYFLGLSVNKQRVNQPEMYKIYSSPPITQDGHLYQGGIELVFKAGQNIRIDITNDYYTKLFSQFDIMNLSWPYTERNILGLKVEKYTSLWLRKLTLLPGQTGSIFYDCTGEPPIGWKIGINGTNGDNFMYYIDIYSNWKPLEK